MTLVLGGARSGKSRHAEALLAAAPPPWTFLATYVPHGEDPEMAARVAEHRARRGPHWRTEEVGIDLAAALARTPALPTLVDCLTLWLGGLMLGEHPLAAATDALEHALATRQAPTVLVANEVGLGIVPETRLGREFRDAAGRLNQRMAAIADRVTLLVAGLPLVIK